MKRLSEKGLGALLALAILVVLPRDFSLPVKPVIPIGSISGTVSDGSNPLGNVKVWCYHDATSTYNEDMTDSFGHYDLTGLEAGNYHLGADPDDATDYIIQQRQLYLNDSENRIEDFSLANGAVRVSGTVTQWATGNPVGGVRVAYNTEGLWTQAQTALDGTYTLANLPLGQARIVAQPEPPLTLAWKGKEVLLAGNLIDFNFLLLEGAILSGVVLDADTSTPVANVRIEYGNKAQFVWKDTRSDGSGNFELRNLPSGAAYIRALPEVATGYAYRSQGIVLYDVTTSQRTPNGSQQVTGYVIGLEEGALLTVEVVDSYGSGIDGLDIAAVGSNNQDARTNVSVGGFYEMRVAPATYTVGLGQEGTYVALPQDVEILDSTDDHNIQLVAYDGSTGETISGEITNPNGDAKNGVFAVVAFPAGTVIDLSNARRVSPVGMAMLDSAGPYEFLVVPGYNYDLYFGILRESSEDEEVFAFTVRGKLASVPAGSAGQNFVYQGSGGIVFAWVRVIEPGKMFPTPVWGASVLLLDKTDNSLVGISQTDHRGRVILTNRACDNSYNVRAGHPDYTEGELRIQNFCTPSCNLIIR